MTPDQIQALRDHARQALAEATVPGKRTTRKEYVSSIVGYALREFGAKDEVRMHAERIARHLWDSTGGR